MVWTTFYSVSRHNCLATEGLNDNIEWATLFVGTTYDEFLPQANVTVAMYPQQPS